MPLAPDVDLVELARRTAGLSGAEIEKTARESALNAVREFLAFGSEAGPGVLQIASRHFDQALAKSTEERRS
jgi:SpoVK/Ycf46/Vps4 family AAA+-type ATPase